MPSAGNLQKDSHDLYILKRLGNGTESVSGQQLADELGLSRVALWKRIEILRKWGWQIESSRSGYRLVVDDSLSPQAIQVPGELFLFDSVDSTMDAAQKQAVLGVPSGSAAVALTQTAGRGRGNGWQSPGGGLYASIIIRNTLRFHAAA